VALLRLGHQLSQMLNYGVLLWCENGYKLVWIEFVSLTANLILIVCAHHHHPSVKLVREIKD